ncbi:unnamed protein product [Cuscuta epithymum]|uniref:DUF632 domain-containing protein n=1 Tax=Cuscuta epithymum TaxID=186058 RepID=A0AAV0GBF8_9ASTE|nr:unnamed protein product [Cuscuta epithymum]
MGCSSSKVDDEESVRLCKDRKKFIQQAVEYRFQFASGHIAYIQSMKRVSDALRDYVEVDEPREFLLDAFKTSRPVPPSVKKVKPSGFISIEPTMRVNYFRPSGIPSVSVEERPPRTPEMFRVHTYSPTMYHQYGMDDGFFSMQSPPTTNSRPENTQWDYFWNPFASLDHYGGYPTTSGALDHGILGDVDDDEGLRHVREKEGIPDLEEESEHEEAKSRESRRGEERDNRFQQKFDREEVLVEDDSDDDDDIDEHIDTEHCVQGSNSNPNHNTQGLSSNANHHYQGLNSNAMNPHFRGSNVNASHQYQGMNSNAMNCNFQGSNSNASHHYRGLNSNATNPHFQGSNSNANHHYQGLNSNATNLHYQGSNLNASHHYQGLNSNATNHHYQELSSNATNHHYPGSNSNIINPHYQELNSNVNHHFQGSNASANSHFQGSNKNDINLHFQGSNSNAANHFQELNLNANRDSQESNLNHHVQGSNSNPSRHVQGSKSNASHRATVSRAQNKGQVSTKENAVADCEPNEDMAGFTVYVNRRPTSMAEVIKDLEAQFTIACTSAKQVSSLLESIRAHYSTTSNDLKSKKMLNPVALLRSASSRSSSSRFLLNPSIIKDEYHQSYSELSDDSIFSSSHQSTLDRLYIWEKKLYQEVRAGERVRLAYEKKCAHLRNQDARGADPSSLERTRATIRGLHTQIKISIHSVESISKRIEALRDDELQPQLLQLVEGLGKMWKVMAECHHIQKRTLDDAKLLLASTPSSAHSQTKKYTIMSQSEPHQLAHSAANLEMELRNWRACFQSWITSQRSYLQALKAWLLRCLYTGSGKTKSMCSPTLLGESPEGAPPIFNICIQWSKLLDSVREGPVLEGLDFFAAGVGSLYAHQMREDPRRNTGRSKQFGGDPHRMEVAEIGRVDDDDDGNDDGEGVMTAEKMAEVAIRVLCAGMSFSVSSLTEFALASAEGYADLLKIREGREIPANMETTS